jgi:hypothetical protein
LRWRRMQGRSPRASASFWGGDLLVRCRRGFFPLCAVIASSDRRWVADLPSCPRRRASSIPEASELILDRPPARATTASEWAVVSGPLKIESGEATPPKRKRPWGAGVFRSRLGGSWVFYISTWRLWGAGKEPREFLKTPRQRTIEVFELVTVTGLPALMTRAVCA